ncbi:hypothetical protein KDA_17510 [Dictyobacter alpinus]|uniref:Mannosyl-glycoprotein endo-beta-N-acetylglucosamidase-like domain-containing protein n=1 Tax=Dictyobacter alpinus TaxID=2014873 RepID=A0A402B4M3_9CHLR|nr:glucosaminidase domain-containing protein [Dictyobacter alpinus]GCE26267.1 hypothetical protein KDA_17510 [Dictyobacter alpinus]
MTSSFSFRSWQKTYLVLVLSSLTIATGGLAGCLWQTPRHSHAVDAVVTGGPSLSATTIDHIFAQMGSPMVGTGTIVEQASRNSNIDDAFAMGVWWAETNDGMAGVGLGNRNPGSVRGSAGYPSGYDGYTMYPSYAAAIIDWFRLISNGYIIGRGVTTVYSISIPYVGTSGAGNWAYKVTSLMARYRYQAPPPAPVPTATTRQHPTSQAGVRVRAYIPIGHEKDWEHLIAEKRRQLWQAKNEGNSATEKSVDVPIHHRAHPIHQTKKPPTSATPLQQQPIFTTGTILVLIAILTLTGLAIGRRKTRGKMVTALPIAVATTSSMHIQPEKAEILWRFTTTEELAPVPVPPTPILVKLGAVPPTPYITTTVTEKLQPLIISQSSTNNQKTTELNSRFSKVPENSHRKQLTK